ncbi:MAG: TetR/AcrR family transcriptional regulator [Clostridia bacterium]|nr:TetR/AcrR family transcriptional regulator [Clostridia bacterium]
MNMHEEEHKLVVDSITEALFQLMEEKPFSEIKITELINKAGIARSTYYRNFDSKEDIVKLFFKSIFDEFHSIHPVESIENHYSPEFIKHILEYLPQYKEKIKVLNKAGISSYYLEMLNQYLLKLYIKPGMSADSIFHIYTIAGAEYNLIFNWYVTEEVDNIEAMRSFVATRQQLKSLID